MKRLTAKWLDRYNSSLDDIDLCMSFESTFGENPSYFGFLNNARKIAEKLMVEYYHNEAYVKSTLIDILKKRSNVTFFEMPVLDSRIDLCSINGHSCAYEIKTNYDTFKRLDKQINDYLKVFEKVYVVCSLEKTVQVESIVPQNVGIIVYDDSISNSTLSIYREALLSDLLDSQLQYESLHKEEKQMFKGNISDKTLVNEYFKLCLKNRYQKKWVSFKKKCSKVNRLDYQYYFNFC